MLGLESSVEASPKANKKNYGLPINFPPQQLTPSSSCTSTLFCKPLTSIVATRSFLSSLLFCPHWAITRYSATGLLSLVMLRATLAILTASALFPTSSLGVHLHWRDINEPLLDSYDRIVVGCGINRPVVTNRLSEIALRTVLCIEAGET